MKERPIIFTAEMIRAILDKRKTQTRRTRGLDDVNSYQGKLTYLGLMKNDCYLKKSLKRDFYKNPGQYHHFIGGGINPIPVKCPYGKVEDHLWVKEKWRIVGWREGEPLVLEYADGTKLEEPHDSNYYNEEKYINYSIDCSDDCEKAGFIPDEYGTYHILNKDVPTRWRNPLYMPRWASRIDLEITGIRAERVQDITIDDIYAEGCSALSSDADASELYEWFSSLWDSINCKKHPWNSNPWVWVIEFKKVS